MPLRVDIGRPMYKIKCCINRRIENGEFIRSYLIGRIRYTFLFCVLFITYRNDELGVFNGRVISPGGRLFYYYI